MIKIYRLKVLAIYADININDIYSDYDIARRNYESWKYDVRVIDAHGYVELVEMCDDLDGKFKVNRELGDRQW